MKKQDCFYGIYPIKFIWNGPWNDPEISYKKHTFNYWDIENFFYEIWKTDSNGCETFEEYMTKNGKEIKAFLNELIKMEKE